MDHSLVKARMDRFEAVCASRGVTLTHQRRAVMEILAPRTDHPTVDQVFQEVGRKIPGVAKATIYRTLETLCGLELIQRVHHPGSAVRFDPNVDLHHHFLCRECDRISDLPIDAVDGHDELEVDEAQVDGQAEGVSLIVYGLCPGCGD